MCNSYSPRRNSFAHRAATDTDCKSINCDAFEVGDVTFWTGAVGTYTETADNARGHYVLGINTYIDGGAIRGSFTPASANIEDGVYLDDANGATVNNVSVKTAVGNGGITTTANSDGCDITNNDVEIQTLTVLSAVYPYTINGATHKVAQNKSKHGQDGFIILSTATQVYGNKSVLAARYGIYVLGNESIVDMNKALNPGSVSATGAAYNYFGKNITCGTNIAADDRATELMYRAVWINANATGITEGQLINRSTQPDIRDDLGAAGRGSQVFGKGATAVDIGTLLTSLRNAGLIET